MLLESNNVESGAGWLVTVEAVAERRAEDNGGDWREVIGVALVVVRMFERSVVDRVVAVLERLQHNERARCVEALIADGGYSVAMAEWGIDAAIAVMSRDAVESYVAEHGAELAGQRVALGLARSVATAPIRSIALCFLRGASAVRVRAPRAQRAVTALWSELAKDEGLDCEIDGELDGRAWLRARAKGDADTVIVFGSDESVQDARALIAGGRFEGHGHGEGVAWIDASVTDDEVQRIAWDFCAYDGVGCLSPSALWVTGSALDARAVSARIAEAMQRWSREVARGPLGREAIVHERAWRSSAAAAATSMLRGDGYCVLVFGEGEGERVSSFGARNVIVRCAGADGASAARWIEEHAQRLTAIAVDAASRARLDRVRGALGRSLQARVVCPGEMQRPPLDGEADPRAAE